MSNLIRCGMLGLGLACKGADFAFPIAGYYYYREKKSGRYSSFCVVLLLFLVIVELLAIYNSKAKKKIKMGNIFRYAIRVNNSSTHRICTVNRTFLQKKMISI